ncbi:MAG: hypothetical protein JO361_09250 [Gammaproteobacteria bacterium]|nr:hypothetical protein [Gammaproteobacteria bacterium]
MRRPLVFPAAFALCLLLLAGAAHPGGAATRHDEILILGNLAGEQQLSTGSDGVTRAEYSFNDRGRGDHIVARWKLDAAGVPTEFEARGNDYMKTPVTESFRIAAGRAAWSSRSEHGSTAVTGEAFYVPVNAPPAILGVLARALLKAPDHRLALLPAGEASLEKAGLPAEDAEGASGAHSLLTLYAVSGLDFSPLPLWLEPDGTTGALVSGWFSVLPAALHARQPRLLAAQSLWSAARAARLGREVTRVPAGDVLIRNARLFDPRDLSVTPGTSVLIRRAHVVRVAPDPDLGAGGETEVIDAHGRFLMPGLWDNHQHFGDNVGALDLANGVTSARDMGNDTDEFLERVARFDAGTELGPRVWKSGIIDGTGPYAGPTKMRIETAAQAVGDVAWYATHGYGQIKIYSSVPPAIVPVIAAEAHARGLRVSGHVPAFMNAEQFVAAGADEIQHLNFIVLDFLWPQVQ